MSTPQQIGRRVLSGKAEGRAPWEVRGPFCLMYYLVALMFLYFLQGRKPISPSGISKSRLLPPLQTAAQAPPPPAQPLTPLAGRRLGPLPGLGLGSWCLLASRLLLTELRILSTRAHLPVAANQQIG